MTLAVAGNGPQGATVGGIRRALAEEFRAAGLDTPALDARILIGHALRLDHAALTAAAAQSLGDAERIAIAALAQRRLANEPVARIVGEKEFWSLRFLVDATTLVPRPETETVVEAALAALATEGRRAERLRIADLGTGSGALLLALLFELPGAFGVGTDISIGALRLARTNARRLGIDRAHFAACDLAAALGEPFDLIVSNPPYVATGDLTGLAPEVRDFDPHTALDGGTDGLRFYRAIAATVPALLRPGGMLAIELGVGQAHPVADLLAAAGLALLPARPDLAGRPRAVVAKKCREKHRERGTLDPGKISLGILARTD
ncbi:MAG: peptide chain release factor N(5)-glutamine methyltransferase [Hyphomicrobiales bacterium]|nr:peptide chain release factor N(5)-glutamine methyltransferase [Hyphomicrobiales bacterium]